MIHVIKRIHNSLKIELKTIIGIILFTIFIVGIERYQISQNIIEQFNESKKSKNHLLIDTIAPIIGLNISLGLDSANKDYLDTIAKQNSYLKFIELRDTKNQLLYSYGTFNDNTKSKEHIDFCKKNINDSNTKEALGSVCLHFSDADYQTIVSKNKELTLKIIFIALILLAFFIYLMKREFKYLKELSEHVLSYDPKLNNCSLIPSSRLDEVGVIHNAIISMVQKINSYTQLLDATNLSLEDKIKERTKELKKANQQLKALSVTDELTQLANRRSFEEYFQNHWELAKRQGVAISIVMCDIDYFKKVNDTYGHLGGDAVLKNIAQIMQTSLKRNTDFIARYGGEEFIIVMYDTNADIAYELCTRIQDNLKNMEDFVFQGTTMKPVTMSFGISSTVPQKDDISEELIKHADNALYKAKDNGRDCIVTSLL
ncbi:MAG: GGDEF domain-containing protein [Sulfurimonas sp.]|jgi:diguanylate cyclase (GGDEF)-like protein